MMAVSARSIQAKASSFVYVTTGSSSAKQSLLVHDNEGFDEVAYALGVAGEIPLYVGLFK